MLKYLNLVAIIILMRIIKFKVERSRAQKLLFLCIEAFVSILIGLSPVRAVAQHPDRIIVDELKKALELENIDSVSISSYMGQVTLSGDVADEQTRLKAERIALTIPGVKRVKSNLVVNPASRASLIASSNCVVPKFDEHLEGKARINMKCEGKTITLIGEIEFAWDEEKILTLVKQANSGFSVTSKLIVTKPSTDEQLFNAVMSALKENNHDLSGISFSVTNRVVTFRGSVKNHRIIDAILATTLMVEGIKEVKSEVVIASTK
ncbi:MAG: BON domain-containing protein [Deltaproteobacteria bacterium]|nr:BON domain-containing protein [Deltaproteobacteria bacterium]